MHILKCQRQIVFQRGNWDIHSSAGRGAMMGQGPFRVVHSDKPTLASNNYTWINVANIIFLDSPVGAGYSYSNTTSDYTQLGDTMAVKDAFTFLVNWLERFPQYKNRSFYIAGDGYAGHCVPQLAYTIHLNNQDCSKININLQGIAIGNGWMDEQIFLKGVYDYYWMHNLISDEMHDGITSACNFSIPILLSPSCLDFIAGAAELVENLNPHDIYSPPCDSSLQNKTFQVKHFDPCTDMYLYSYFNRPDVQGALHAHTTWNDNSSLVKDWKDMYPFISPIIKQLMGDNISIWLYSGDTDIVVPITSTQYFVDSLQLPIQTDYYPWYSGGEVAGFGVGYENLTFVHVQSGGHYVPSYQPDRALTLFSSFLEGKLPPSSP